jgi:RNA polymerase sigma-70 factor (ECF subfamily)
LTTGSSAGRHSLLRNVDAPAIQVPFSSASVATNATVSENISFLDIYEANFTYVWRAARRLGVDPGSLDDVVQEVLLTAHRRLPSFEGRSSIKTWLFGIVLRVVRDHKRALSRKDRVEVMDVERFADPGHDDPHQSAERAQHRAVLHQLLDALDDEKREVFVLAELEQMTAPEIAVATGANVNTVYWRLRAAREEFNQAAARYRARTERGQR